MLKPVCAVLAALIVLGAAMPSGASATEDPDAVRQRLMSTFDRPDARLAVEPIVVAKDYAVAGWIQAELAGRALLRRGTHAWTIVFCGGAALKDAGELAKIGVPQDQAEVLAAGLATAEARLGPERIARFDSFGALMAVEGDAHHGQGEPQKEGSPRAH